jgi:hypothetical protein
VRATARTEPKSTSELGAYLRRRLPQPLDYTKHADQFTSGIPDVTIAWQGFTTWIECKMLKPGKSLDSELRDDQLLYCRRLEGATNRRCWILVWNLRDKDMEITELYAPSLVVRMRRDGFELPAATPNGDRLQSLPALGYAWGQGINHEMVFDLIRRTHRFGWDR